MKTIIITFLTLCALTVRGQVTLKQPVYYDIGFSGGKLACAVCGKRPVKGQVVTLLVVASNSTRVGLRFIHTTCDSTGRKPRYQK